MVCPAFAVVVVESSVIVTFPFVMFSIPFCLVLLEV
jgi:hypothetical protein